MSGLMPVPRLRVRQEDFGYIIAFSSGEIGFYESIVKSVLTSDTTPPDIEPFRLKSIPVEHGFHLRAPLIVWFEITRNCNLPCKHCYVEAGPGRARDQECSTSEIFAILDQLRAAGVFALVLVGGEPMSRPDFLEILWYAHRLGFVISIATNGTFLTEEVIRQLPRHECIVSVSIDGVGFHQELRVRSTFEDLKMRMLLLKKYAIPGAVMSTQTDRNVEELMEVFRFAHDNGFFFGSTPFSAIGRGRFFSDYEPRVNIVNRAADLFMLDKRHDLKMMETVGLCVAKFLDECHRIARTTQREFCGVSMAYILSNGLMYPCSICASNNKFLAGDLREKSFEHLWEHAFDSIRSIDYDMFKLCPTCELSKDPYYCTSRCPVMAELYTGDQFGCGATDFVKASLKRRTDLYAAEFPSCV
jgi:AdoMet-dependent heme synthase